MANHTLNENYNGKTMLRKFWPIVKSNFANLLSWFNAHISGTADRHTAEHIDYDSGTTVKAKIDKEITDRQSGDSALQGKINTETTNRVNGDNALQNKITAEINNRQEADDALDGKITTEVTNRENGDTEIKKILGNKNDLATTNKTNFVGAINELKRIAGDEQPYIRFINNTDYNFCTGFSYTADNVINGTFTPRGSKIIIPYLKDSEIELVEPIAFESYFYDGDISSESGIVLYVYLLVNYQNGSVVRAQLRDSRTRTEDSFDGDLYVSFYVGTVELYPFSDKSMSYLEIFENEDPKVDVWEVLPYYLDDIISRYGINGVKFDEECSQIILTQPDGDEWYAPIPIGNKQNLSTAEKVDLVSAINEVYNKTLQTIDGDKIAANSITGGYAIETPGDIHVDTNGHIAIRTITGDNIDYSTIKGDNIGNKEIKTANIDDKGVTTAKIADKAVGTAQIADKAVTGQQIETKTITNWHMNDGAIQEYAIEDGAVTARKIANGTITADKLASGVLESSFANFQTSNVIRTGTWVDGTPMWRVMIPLLPMTRIVDDTDTSHSFDCEDMLLRLGVISRVSSSIEKVVYIDDKLVFQNEVSTLSMSYASGIKNVASGHYRVSGKDTEEVDYAQGFWGWIEFATPESNIKNTIIS